MDFNFGIIDHLVKSAEKLGGLTPAAIFAFMWLWQSVKEVRKEARESKIKEHENDRREQSILSEERQTEAMRSMAQNIITMREAQVTAIAQLTTLNTVINERMPRGH